MKKVLLGSSALVAFGLAAPAYAQLDLNITGSVDTHFGIVSDDAADGEDRDYGGFTDFTLNLNLDGVSDNGLRYGARVNIDDQDGNRESSLDNTTVIIDEAWIFVNGDFGEIRLGDKEGMATTLGRFGVPGTGTGIADGDFGAYAASTPPTGTTVLGGFTDGTRISYFGTFGGATIGISFAPSEENRLGDPDLDNDFSAVEDRIDIGGNYRFTFEGGSLVVGGGLSWGDDPDVGDEDLFSYVIAAQASFGGFTAGGFYANHGDSLSDIGGPGGDFEQAGFGATYRMDALTVGANVLWGQDNRDTTDREGYAAGVGAQYALFPGFTPYAEVVFYQHERPDGPFRLQTDGVVVIMGATAAW